MYCTRKKIRGEETRSRAFQVGVGGLAFVVNNGSTCHKHRATVALDEEREKLSFTEACSRHAIKLQEHLEFGLSWGA